MSEANECIRIERSEGVAWVTIDAPPMNLLGAALMGGLYGLVEAMEQDDASKVLVLRSADPDFFVAHGDVESITTVPTDPVPEAKELPFTHQIMERIRRLPQVTIAQIEGYARGGGSELSLACDMRFATLDKAVFGQPEIALGILPGAGGTARLARLLGRARATEVILGGDDFTAAEAERYGWINRALPADEIGPFVTRLARRIASFPRQSLITAKQTLLQFTDGEIEADLLTEQRAFDHLMSDPRSERVPRMERFLADGVQTRDGERRLADACEKLGNSD